MIEFGWPWFFYLAPLPLLAWLLPRANRQEAALKTPSFNRLKSLAAELEPRSSRMLWRSLVLLLWLCIMIAGSQPKWVGDAITLPSSGRDLLLAVDISGSMGTEDMSLNGQMVTRLAAVKAVVGEFVERRRGDRLLDRPAANRVLILLTDGVNNVGEVSPIQAAKLAAQEGITIYTIGFGADEMAVSGLLFNRTVNPSAELDTETLTEIASLTGGLYQRARSTQELANIYLALDELEPIEVDQETYRPEKSLFFWPLGSALVLSLFVAGFWLLKTTLAERAFTPRDPAEGTP